MGASIEQGRAVREYSSIADCVLDGRYSNPSGVAIDTGSEKITHAELAEMVGRVAWHLQSKGLKAGELIALTFMDELTLIVTALAVSAIGGAIGVVRRTMLAPFYQGLQQRLNVTTILCDVAHSSANGVRVIRIVRGAGSSIAIPQGAQVPVSPDFTLPAGIQRFSFVVGSGSTGQAKIFSVSHLQEISYLQSRVLAEGMRTGDSVAHFTHAEFTSARRLIFSALAAGCTVKLYPKERPQTYAELAHSDVSILHLSVIALHALVNDFGGNKDVFRNLKLLGSGGSMISDALRNQVDQWLPDKLHIVYASNEIDYFTMASPAEWRGRPHVVGRPIEGMEAQVVDAQGRQVGSGAAGLLRFRKQHMLTEYWNDRPATEQFFRSGWFYPMDIGSIDESGLVSLYGRADDLMIFNGINIFPAEIELALQELPGVLDVAAFPLRHPVHQDLPVCAVVIENGSHLNEAEILKFGQAKLGPVAPRKVFMLDEIPRDAQGKLLRPQLRQLLDALTA